MRSGRFVYGHHDLKIPQPLFAWSQRRLIVHYAFRHVVHFGGKMVSRLNVFFLDGVAPPYPHSLTAVAGRGLQFEPSIGPDHPISVLARIAVAGGAIRQCSTWKAKLKINRLFDLLESYVTRSVIHHRVDPARLFARDITRSLQAINPNVHQ